MTGITLVLRFVVITLIYIILFRLIRIMILELRKIPEKSKIKYAVEVVSSPKVASFNKGTIFPIREQLTIGRKKNNMIIINDPFISASHAVLFVIDGELFLKDLGSTNGTNHNNVKVTEDTKLDIGDIIKIGKLVLKVI